MGADNKIAAKIERAENKRPLTADDLGSFGDTTKQTLVDRKTRREVGRGQGSELDAVGALKRAACCVLRAVCCVA